MSTATLKRSLALAAKDAADFIELCAGTFERWEVAGSVRRQRESVSDIEHVAIPKFGDVPAGGDGGLFAERGNLLNARLDQLVKDSVIMKHLYNASLRWGEKYRGADFRGFNHEVFQADADNWGPQLAIRTGPADYSKMLVTKLMSRGYRQRDGYVRNWQDWCCTCGWAGSEVEWVRASGGKWKEENRGTVTVAACPNCNRSDGVNPAKVSVPTEKEFFALCGMAWREPAERQ